MFPKNSMDSLYLDIPHCLTTYEYCFYHDLCIC